TSSPIRYPFLPGFKPSRGRPVDQRGREARRPRGVGGVRRGGWVPDDQAGTRKEGDRRPTTGEGLVRGIARGTGKDGPGSPALALRPSRGLPRAREGHP